MFDVYDRLRSYLMGLERVRTGAIGGDEGFFYQAKDGLDTLFCTLNINPLRYRFQMVQALALPKGFPLEPVRGWPGWAQVVNPCCEHEETLWQCLQSAYQQVALASLHKEAPSKKPQTPSRVGTGGNHVAKSA